MEQKEEIEDMRRQASILVASIDATLSIACETRMDIMGGTTETNKFIKELTEMKNHLDKFKYPNETKSLPQTH